MGHGAGEKFLNRRQLDCMHNLENLVFLMGCSSCSTVNPKMLGYRKMNLNGVLLDYLSSDWLVTRKQLIPSLMIVGNLWSVTDKDSDKIVLALLDILKSKRFLVSVEDLILSLSSLKK